MFDSLLGSIADVLNKVASKIPGVNGIPWADITAAFTTWGAAVKIWMDTFPFLWHMALSFGLMMAVLVAKIGYYWIMWLVRKIPGVS